MTYAEMKKMDRAEVTFIFMMSKMIIYREKINRVTLLRQPNGKGRLVSSIVVYLTDKNQNLHQLNFRLYDEQYLWFMCALAEDFPHVKFEDLTPEEYKLVKTKNDFNITAEVLDEAEQE